MKNTIIPYSIPEKQGLDSLYIKNFITKLEKNQVNIHSLIIMLNNHIITEGYYSPIKPDTLQRMFSITKSFVSIAVGILADKGKIGLDDKIVNYFPDKLPKNPSNEIMKLTIRNMLKMSAIYEKTTFNEENDIDWVKTFFTTAASHNQGTFFAYDSSAAHILAALVEKVTGQSLIDFLRDCFLDKIGFSKEAYIIKDPNGFSMGGSGLMAYTLDIAAFAYAVINKGVINGETVIPKWYLDEATKIQIDTRVHAQSLEESYGYGYYFWICRDNCFACYGLAGQIILFAPNKKLVLITTADTQLYKEETQKIYDIFFDEIYDNISSLPLMENEKRYMELNKKIKNLELITVKGNKSSEILSFMNDKFYVLSENILQIEKIKLLIDNDEGKFLFIQNNKIHTIYFGINKNKTETLPLIKYKYAASGAWIDKNIFFIKLNIIDEEICIKQIQLCFNELNVTFILKSKGGKKKFNINTIINGEREFN